MGFVKYVRDTFQNLVTGLGQPGVDPGKSIQYTLDLLARDTLENMYRGDWLARKIVDQPAEDITREWRAWQANQAQIEAIELVEKTLDIQRKVKQWIIKARLYGGSALVIGVDDGNPPSQPIDLEKCKKGCLKYVVVLHRFELNAGPRIYNVMDPYYTRAAYYTVATPMFGFSGQSGLTMPNIPGQPPLPAPGAIDPVPAAQKNVVPMKGAKGMAAQGGALYGGSSYPTNTYPIIGHGFEQIHPSRVLELPGNELPDWRLAPLGGGWGDSSLQTVVDMINTFITTYSSIGAMVSDGKLDVVKIPDMTNNLTDTKYKERLIDRFALSAQTKSVISALLLDKEEEWERVSTAYGGLDMILHEFLTLVSGASDIPVSILFGQAYGRGLQGGSTGGGADDVRSYYDKCTTKQKNDIAPRLGMLDQVLMRSALGKEDPNVNYTWNPLWQLSDDDKAKIGFAKAQSTQIYAGLGLINEDALREGVVNQLIEDAVYPGLDDAIEEYGSEPEDPDQGGFEPGGFEDPDSPSASKGEPNPDDTGFSAQMGDKGWSEEAREASAEARRVRAQRIAEFTKRAEHHERKADQHKEGSRKAALHRMAANSYRAAIKEYSKRGGDPEVAELHAAVAQHMNDAIVLDEAAGHKFHGNQHTGGIGGGETLHGNKVRAFFEHPKTKEVVSLAAEETTHMGHHFGMHAAELAIGGAIAAGLTSIGLAAAPATVVGAVAGYAVQRLAHALGFNPHKAHELLTRTVSSLRKLAETKIEHMAGTHALSFGDADDSVLRSLRLFENALRSHPTEQLMHMAGKHMHDEEAGHPFRGNQYTKGESGGQEDKHPGKGYSKNASVDENGVIHTSSVMDAQLALSQNRKVELSQVRQVSILLARLGAVAQNMRAKGEKAPVYDLCNVSVKGTNLFCAESHSINRIKMPQFADKKQSDDFVALMRSKYKTEDTKEFASYLRPTQNQLNGATVAWKMSQYRKNPSKADEPIIVSRDNYILDGHHGWGASIGIDAEDGKLNSGKKMNVIRVDVGTIQLLQEALRFTGKKGRKGIADKTLDADWDESKHPRGESGKFAFSGENSEALLKEGEEYELPTSEIDYYDPPDGGAGDEGYNVEELMQSMKDEGGWSGPPILVGRSRAQIEKGDHKIYAFNGNHRLAAARELGIKSIPVINAAPDSDDWVSLRAKDLRKGTRDRRLGDYREDQPRGKTTERTNAGSFAPASSGGAEENVLAGHASSIEEGAGTFGKSEPAGGEKASPGVPASLVKAIEDHIGGVGGEFGAKGSGDLTEWLMRTHRAEMLKLIDDMPPNKRPMLLLHKGDETTGVPSVWLLGWSATEKTDIHDHVRSEVGISVLRGTTDNEWNIPGPGYLEQAKSQEGLKMPINKDQLTEGQTVTLQAPYIHLMRGVSSSKASGKRDVTVHAYHPPLKQMHYFKARGGALHYDGDWDEDRPPSEYAARDAKFTFFGCACCQMARNSK